MSPTEPHIFVVCAVAYGSVMVLLLTSAGGSVVRVHNCSLALSAQGAMSINLGMLRA